MKILKKAKPLREQLDKKLISQTDTPVIIFLILFLAIYATTFIKRYDEELSQNLLSELIGAAFIILVVNILLVRSKNKRWKRVNGKVDYLISRFIFRFQDGLALRAFQFKIEQEEGQIELIQWRLQREKFLDEIVNMSSPDDWNALVKNEFYTIENLNYFEEKSHHLWEILNMKYAEYLNPQLIELLMDLYLEMNDLCAHLKAYLRNIKNYSGQITFANVAKKGVVLNIHNLLILSKQLKDNGYSELPKTEWLALED
ncbi:MAG: hypothetical protein JJT77_11250 [Crocinitomicaceae bacterium]|nr:hypothetical protein [Crocinitomicaceae bacterium]